MTHSFVGYYEQHRPSANPQAGSKVYNTDSSIQERRHKLESQKNCQRRYRESVSRHGLPAPRTWPRPHATTKPPYATTPNGNDIKNKYPRSLNASWKHSNIPVRNINGHVDGVNIK
ncbi:hypothetical protein Naga_100781g3 [Nannochloropsis gaditana]|uniref:Uncharacterized protein n=1 Tax=Nannochloropsis gaditana TaxID=72520 RepID=W7T1M5_9STRA|nr:hypothetical protein Naga_100781g3 [Nannochloropsis gaditana]